MPVPEGCSGIPSSLLPDCGASRAVQAGSGPGSVGLLTNSSSTWDQIGLEYLGSEQNLYGPMNEAGLYGLDTVGFGADEPKYEMSDQLVAGISTWDFWSGSLGLGVNPSQFDVVSTDISSLLPSMKQMNLTPSNSYGYTPGASYSRYAFQKIWWPLLIFLFRICICEPHLGWIRPGSVRVKQYRVPN